MEISLLFYAQGKTIGFLGLMSEPIASVFISVQMMSLTNVAKMTTFLPPVPWGDIFKLEFFNIFLD